MKRLDHIFFTRLLNSRKQFTIPTLITLLRIVSIPFLLLAMLANWWGTAFFLFCGAVLSDIVDGNLARWMHQESLLGACLDPIADKLLMVTVFSTLAFVEAPLFTIPKWFLIFVVSRELLLVLGVLFLYLLDGHVKIRPTWMGKASMIVQSVFVVWLFACYFFQWLPVKTYHIALWLVVIVVGISWAQYVAIGFEHLLSDKPTAG